MELWTTWYTGQNSLATKIITMETVKRTQYEDSVGGIIVHQKGKSF
jgi:hypothetical protein